ncbi:unnamed protein product [Lampetra fluviatilis]
MTLRVVDVAALPDGGERLRQQLEGLQRQLRHMDITGAPPPPPAQEPRCEVYRPGPTNHVAPPTSHDTSHDPARPIAATAKDPILGTYGVPRAEVATYDLISRLSQSLDGCPPPWQRAPDPPGLKAMLCRYSVVLTTYNLVAREVGDGGQRSGGQRSRPQRGATLGRVNWARLVLDEAHNVKNPKVSLPRKEVVVHRLELSSEEMEVYGAILQSSKLASQFPGDCGKSVDGGQGSGVIHILTLLLRLRQSCCHPALLRTVNTGTL